MREQARESQIARGGQQSAVADSNLAKVVLRGDQPPVYAMQNHAAHHVPVYVDHRGTHHFMMVADPSPSAESGGPPISSGCCGEGLDMEVPLLFGGERTMTHRICVGKASNELHEQSIGR